MEGKGAALIMPACNTEAMNLHLAEIAKIVAPRAHAVLLVDQAGWHMSTHLTVPPNMTIIALPPKSPELNPVENVWQFMRDNWLSNRVFKSYDELVDHCCTAWNNLIDQPWRIMSIGLRDWAHGFYHWELVLGGWLPPRPLVATRCVSQCSDTASVESDYPQRKRAFASAPSAPSAAVMGGCSVGTLPPIRSLAVPGQGPLKPTLLTEAAPAIAECAHV
jgi:putative transposase